MTHKVPLLIIVSAVTLAIAACGSSTSHVSSSSKSTPSTSAPGASTSRAQGAGGRVLVSGYAFHPSTVTVKPGTKLVFTNRDQTAHTATSSAGTFDTGAIAPGASRTVVLRRPGSYTYYCQFHAFMRATLVVK